MPFDGALQRPSALRRLVYRLSYGWLPRWLGRWIASPNVRALRELRRVVRATLPAEFDMRFIDTCAYGCAVRDPWFIDHRLPEQPGDTGQFFGLSAADAERLFAWTIDSLAQAAISQQDVIDNIDRLLAGKPARRYAALPALRADE